MKKLTAGDVTPHHFGAYLRHLYAEDIDLELVVCHTDTWDKAVPTATQWPLFRLQVWSQSIRDRAFFV